MERNAYAVKGSGIKTKFEFVEERFGADALVTFRARLADVVQWPILVGGWYAFDKYDAVLRAIVELFYEGRTAALREVGAYSADKLLASTYQAFRTRDGIISLIERLPALYQRFYNCGTMTIDAAPETRYCGFRFSGAPVYVVTDMEVAVGFTKQCWQIMGADAAISRLNVTERDATFDLYWKVGARAAAGSEK